MKSIFDIIVTANIIPDTHQSNGNAPVIFVPFWLENCLVDCTSNSCWWLVSCLWQIRLLSHTHEHPSSAERITINQLKQNSEQHKANTWKHMQNIKTGFLQFRHRRHADQDAQGIKQEGNAPSPANYGVYGALCICLTRGVQNILMHSSLKTSAILHRKTDIKGMKNIFVWSDKSRIYLFSIRMQGIHGNRRSVLSQHGYPNERIPSVILDSHSCLPFTQQSFHRILTSNSAHSFLS